MSQQKVDLLVPRDFGSLLQDSIQFFIENFKPLGKAILMYAGPLMLIQGIALGLYQSKILQIQQEAISNPSDASDPFAVFGDLMQSFFTTEFWVSTLFGLLVYAMLISLVNHYLILYLDKGPGNFNEEDLRSGAFSDFGTNLLAIVVTGILLGIAAMFFVFPAIYVFVPLSLIFMTMKYEQIGMGAALSRTFTLVKGHWWQTFGLIFILSILVAMVAFIFQIPLTLSSFTSLLGIEAFSSKTFMIVAGLVATVGRGVLQAVVIIGIGLQFFNILGLSGDGNSLEDRIDEIGREFSP